MGRLMILAVVALVATGDDGSVTMRRDGETYHPIRLFWFAWYAFHPETDLAQ